MAVLYFSANPNGEAKIVMIFLHGGIVKKLKWDINFADIIGGVSKDNLVSTYHLKN